MLRKPISADSHITEPPNCYVDFIDPKFSDRAPLHQVDSRVSATPSSSRACPPRCRSACSRPPARSRPRSPRTASPSTTSGASGWDPKYRAADQDLDGVAAEMIYPTVGMLLCNHPDFDYKKACFDAYNRWLAEYCAEAPDRLFGLAQVSMRTPEEGVAELKAVQAMGFKGVMMPGDPAVEDYDCKLYDPVWATAVELGLPLSFHILTTQARARWPRTRAARASTASCPSSAAARTSWAR